MSSVTSTICKEIEIHFTGNAVPYIPESGPSLSGPGEPAEGGYCEDLAIEDITMAVHDPSKDQKTLAGRVMGYKSVSILEGIDTTNPEVQKLLQNILDIVEDDAQEALSQNLADEPYYGDE